MSRPSWHSVWMDIAKTISKRSYDPRLQVGSIIVTDDNSQLLSLGYNGNYKGGPNEVDSKQPGESGFIHAEVNALVKCDYNHHKKKIMYVTHSPCVMCAKLIVNGGISEVVYDVQYRDTSGITILLTSGVKVNKYEELCKLHSKNIT